MSVHVVPYVCYLASAFCSITVPLKRLKHFDCKEKQELLVGGLLSVLH